MKLRIKKLQRLVKAENLDYLLVSQLSHIQYLTGFSCTESLDGLVLIGPNSADLFTDFRYKDQADSQVKGARIHIVERNILKDLVEYKPLQKVNTKIGFQSENMLHGVLSRLSDGLGTAVLIPTADLVEGLAMVKDKDEIALIKEAVRISDTAFERILGIIKPGVREMELAAELEYQMKMLGSEKPSFDTIAASGYRSAMPHGLASMKKIKKGEFLTFDFGATYEGYVSDITRTVVIGKATSRQKKIYNLVLKAQLKAINAAKAGMSGAALDKVARDVIKKGGYGKQFGHGLGHGIGLMVHEGPRVSPMGKDDLRPGNVVTIEPGIYIPNWGGVRIEDDVVIRRNSCTVLNKAPKELLEL